MESKKCLKRLSCKQFINEFHYSRFWLFHHDWKALTYVPWIPFKWQFQWIYVVYRWIMAAYFFSWLVVAGISREEGPLFLIYLTNWSLITFVSYLLIAASSVTVKFFMVHWCCKKAYTLEDFSRAPTYQFKKPAGCCGYKSNTLSWYQSIHWVSFSIGGELPFIIMLLYFSLLYDGRPIDAVNANSHLVNGIMSLVDILLTGVPVSLLHVIYPVSFGSTFAVFSGIYFVANGTDPDGNPYIYTIIDYDSNPGRAALIGVLMVFLVVPVFHLILYALFIVRFWIVYALFGRNIHTVACWEEEQGRKDEPTEQNVSAEMDESPQHHDSITHDTSYM